MAEALETIVAFVVYAIQVAAFAIAFAALVFLVISPVVIGLR